MRFPPRSQLYRIQVKRKGNWWLWLNDKTNHDNKQEAMIICNNKKQLIHFHLTKTPISSFLNVTTPVVS